MADPEESPDPESGSDSRHGKESDPYRLNPCPSGDEETLFLPGEQLLTEAGAGLSIEETGSQGEAGDRTQHSSAQQVSLPMDSDFPFLTSIYWGNCPTASEENGTVEGENARLWMQVGMDLVLEDALEVPAPGRKRTIELLDLSPARLRKIYSALYPHSKGKRLTCSLAFCTSRAAVSPNLHQYVME